MSSDGDSLLRQRSSLPFDPSLLGVPDRERSNAGQPRSKLVLYWVGFLPVFMLYGMVGYGYAVLMLVEGLPNIMGRNIALAIVELVVGHAALGLFFTAYHRVLYTSPGDIPSWFNDDVLEKGPSSSCVERTMFGERRACDKCRMFKPDRTHHCRVCQRCVLKMDHHCPWVNNCVGFHNYKFFVLFLMYVPMICFLGILFSVPTCFRIQDWTTLGVWEIQLFVVVIMCAVFGVGISLFAAVHLRMVLINQTTLESMELAYTSGVNPYDVGTMRKNFEQVFGEDPYYWFLPVATSIGDGCYFPLNPKVLEEMRRYEDDGDKDDSSTPSTTRNNGKYRSE